MKVTNLEGRIEKTLVLNVNWRAQRFHKFLYIKSINFSKILKFWCQFTDIFFDIFVNNFFYILIKEDELETTQQTTLWQGCGKVVKSYT